MKLAPLPDVTKIIMGQSPPSSTYNKTGDGLPFFQGKADFGDMYPTIRMFCSEPNKIAEPGDILISVRAPVGPTNIAPVLCCVGRGLAAIRSSKKIDSKYLLYFLRFYEPQLAQSSTGSTFDAISRSDLDDVKIPLPPLDEQRRVTDILSRADRLRRLRRTALELSDGYLQSVFLEMFGDPVSNPMGWEIKPLGKVVKNLDSRRIPIKESDRAARSGPYPYYGATGIIDYLDGYIFDETALLIAEDGKNLRHRTKPIAFMAYGKYWVNNHAHVVKGNGKVELLYLMESLNYRDIDRFVTGIDQFKLTRSSLDTIPVQVPPFPLQQKFADIVRQVERLRSQQREALRQAEGLFQALLHEAFE